jgi:hypothetical protein
MAAAPAIERVGPGAPPIATFRPGPKVLIPRWLLLLGLIVGQALLARLMSQQPAVGQVQALALVGLILYAAVQRSTSLTLCVLAYLPGAEITWRQAQVALPYLTTPYLMTFAALLALGTSHNQLTKAGRTAILYIGLLLPSIVITFSATGAAVRELVAFALAGPVALAALVVFFSQLTISTWLYRRLLWIMLISGVGPLAIALTAINDYIVNVGAIEFGTESNAITSGGFGPVQVSSLMGLTVLVAVLLFFVERELVPRILIVALGVLSMGQSLLTFSRGGMFATAIALAGLALSQAGNRRTRMRTLGAVAGFFVVGYFLVVPRIDAFTQGKFEERFSSTETGRTTLASNDLELFFDNVTFGVGPGMSKYRQISYDICQLRSDRCAREGSSHTEFTRMPAEHGLPGIAAIGAMILLALQALRRAGPSLGVSVCMVLWAISQMFYANLRVAAVPFAFALAFLRVREPDDLDASGDPPEPDPVPAPAPAPAMRRGLSAVPGA